MSIIEAFIMPHPPIIVPEVGKGQEQQIQETSNSFLYELVKIAEQNLSFVHKGNC